MLQQFGVVFTFLVIGLGFVLVSVTISHLLGPFRPNKTKSIVYECGELPVGSGAIQFNLRFYLVTFVFVIFDVEIAIMYPVTVVFKEMLDAGWGLLVFVEIAVFVAILMTGFIYAWSEGGLDWVKDKVKQDVQS